MAMMKAREIEPGDVIDGKRVAWSIPNALRIGQTEIKYETGETVFFRNTQKINAMRPPEVTCYLCKTTFRKDVKGAAHNRNYYRCAECLKRLRRQQRL